jgi:glycosyltransferase involved in cell wall biosynthesis
MHSPGWAIPRIAHDFRYNNEGMEKVSLTGLRILHVHTLPIVSGSGINTLLTMQGSRDCGAEVGLASAPGGKLEMLVREGGMYFYPIRNFVSEVSPFKDLHALWQLNRLLAREKFDLVHTHNSKGGILGRLAARWNHVPSIIHTVHGFAFHEEESWFFRRLFIVLERMAARWCDQMIAISQPMVEWAQRERIAPPETFVKIYERFRNEAPSPELRSRFGIQPEETVIGVVSKLWEGKGHEVLIDALARLLEGGCRVKLLVVGEGYLEEKLKEKVKELGIEQNVIFTGFWSDVPEITALLDISVLPSFYEGMGRVVLEAMAAGKPVVASRVGGIPEFVEDEVTGYLISPGDVDALVQKLETLISDSDLRQKMGQKGAERMRDEHSAETMVNRIHHVYERHRVVEDVTDSAHHAVSEIAGGSELGRQESKLGARLE